VSGPAFIGLTGGIGAGKTEALEAFARLGAETLSTDAVAHELLERADVQARLVDRWGPEVIHDGSPDRDRIAALVFSQPDELRWLEEQLHPLVRERMASWRDALDASASLAVVEVPLLHESGMAAIFDAVVCVTAEEATRQARAEARGLGSLDGRSERQLSQAEKAAASTYVVENNGTLAELSSQLGDLLPELRAKGG
jgi:dephospho-CoA kinase